MTANGLLNEIPPRLRYQRQPLPDEKNALLPWQEAIAGYQRLEYESDGISSLMYGWCEWETPAKPTAEDWLQIERWINANESALSLLDQGIARGRLQLPPQLRLTLEPTPLSTPTMELREFGRLVCLRRVMASQRQDSAAAVADAIRQLRLSSMILRGEGYVIDLLMGTALLSSAFDSVCAAAQPPERSSAIHAELAASMADVPDLLEAAWTAASIEVCEYGLSMISMLPQTNDAGKLADCLLPLFYSGAEWLKSYAEIMEEAPPSDAVLQKREEQRREQLERLLDGHPLLFDAAATARLMGELTLAQLESLEQEQTAAPPTSSRIAEWFRRRWRPTADELLEDAWPHVLQPGFDFQGFGDDEVAVAKRAQMIRDWREWGYTPARITMPTSRQLGQHRELLRQVDNPVGRIVANTLASFAMPRNLLDKLQGERAAAQQALRARE